jgi:hypothetical protein
MPHDSPRCVVHERDDKHKYLSGNRRCSFRLLNGDLDKLETTNTTGVGLFGSRSNLLRRSRDCDGTNWGTCRTLRLGSATFET